MQLAIISAIVFAIAGVFFALQNNVPVTVNFFLWRFDGSLALVLLLALGLGALIAALVSTPSVIRGQWGSSRLRRQVAALEEEKARLEGRLATLEAETARLRPPADPAAEPKRFGELRSMLTGEAGPSGEKTP